MSLKRIIPLMLAMLLLFALSAAAEEAIAPDLSKQCTFDSTYSKVKKSYLVDGKYKTAWESGKALNPYLAMHAKSEPIAGVYVCFGKQPAPWELQISADGKNWTHAATGDHTMLHCYVALPEPSMHVRLMATSDKKTSLFINEIHILGKGKLPDWVQTWQPTHEKADILFVSTHADDELIFFGGAIPTYAAERGSKVVVAYFAPERTTRTSEALNGLWHMGVRHYPILGPYPDTKAKNLSDAYNKVGGKEEVTGWFVNLYRQYRPEVVVTQDIDGEYGHTQHLIVSQACIDAVDLAADPDKYPDSASCGPWLIKKLYLHLWPEDQLIFDWEVPLQSMGGKTGMQLADEAFEQFHLSQGFSSLGVRTTGLEYDNRVFGLVHSTVGVDSDCDFLDNIDLGEE